MSFSPIKEALQKHISTLSKYDQSQKKHLLDFLAILAESIYVNHKPATSHFSSGGSDNALNLVEALSILYGTNIPSNGSSVQKLNSVINELIGEQSVAQPNILFLGFKNQRRHIVQKISVSWNNIDRWVKKGIEGVGHHKVYDDFFGKKSWASKTSYKKREAMVREKLLAIKADTKLKWTIQWRPMGSDIASLINQYNMTIGEGIYSRHASSENLTGFLIHEIGHNNGLEDVCDECRKKELKESHFKNRGEGTMKCLNNSSHGRCKNHFIGTQRSKALVSISKNCTVWNTDNYRWYCYYLNGGKVMV